MAFHASGEDLKRYLDSTRQDEPKAEVSPEDSLKEWRRLAGFMNKLGTINK